MDGANAIGLFIDDDRQEPSLNNLSTKPGKHFLLYRTGNLHERPKKSSAMEHRK